MNKTTSCLREARRNRALINIVMLIVVMIMIINFSQWLDIVPSDIQLSLMPITYSKDSTIIMPKEYMTILNSRYISDQKEFVYCLYGDAEGKNVIIKDMKETTVTYATHELAFFTGCKETTDYLGIIHSHPQYETQLLVATCELSDTDKEKLLKGTDGGLDLIGIICGEDRIAFYTANNLEESLRIEKT